MTKNFSKTMKDIKPKFHVWKTSDRINDEQCKQQNPQITNQITPPLNLNSLFLNFWPSMMKRKFLRHQEDEDIKSEE